MGAAAHLLPRPSPLLAPFTRPAMSTTSTLVGTVATELFRRVSTASRSSGTATMPTLGSMVQNGKFAAWALPFSQRALNSVDCKDIARRKGTQETMKANTQLCEFAVGPAALSAGPLWHCNLGGHP